MQSQVRRRVARLRDDVILYIGLFFFISAIALNGLELPVFHFGQVVSFRRCLQVCDTIV